MSSPNDLTTRATELSARVDQLRAQQALAEARAAAEQATIDRLLAQLDTEFGVDSFEKAQELLDRVDKRLAEEIGRVESELAGTGSDG